jgi:metal-responsive CopG/Arc/MetJ family transcriptional regulator
MRVHITMTEADVRRLDERVGVRRRSRFITEAVRRALEDEERWESIEAAVGSVAPDAHEWDPDPAAWVRAQRQSDRRRVG